MLKGEGDTLMATGSDHNQARRSHDRRRAGATPSCGISAFRRFGVSSAPRARRAGFTLIELLVVVAIILVLLAAIVHVGGWAFHKGQAKNTEAVLGILADACTQFKESAPLGAVKQKSASASGIVTYAGRYGNYPPDELEIFSKHGLPGSDPKPPDGNPLIPGGASIRPDLFPQPYDDMKFYTTGAGAKPEFEHRDNAALVLAIELFSEEAASTLARIPSRNWKPVANDSGGKPLVYIDRDASDDYTDGDEPIRYVVDNWTVPIAYMAQRDYRASNPVDSSNHKTDWSWNQVSSRLVKLNGDAPVIFSWGPDGREQLTEAGMGAEGKAHLGADWMTTLDNSAKDRVDFPLNTDNVYANPALSEILSKGK